MLVLLKDKDGIEKAINFNNVEFEVRKNPNDASKVDLTIIKSNGEIIESTIPEEKYFQLLDLLESERKIIRL